MSKPPFQRHEISDRSKVMPVKSALSALCRRKGFTPHQIGKVEIIAGEIMTNQLKYGMNNVLMFRSVKINNLAGVEILGIDSGPGMENVKHYLKDGVSSGDSSLGTGLGAISRLSDQFDIYSYPGRGTVIFSRVIPGLEKTDLKEDKDFNSLSVCYPGADVCGDLWGYRVIGGQNYFMVCDGLGHGLPAHEASQRALKVFSESEGKSAVELITEIHNNMNGTRGGVAAVLNLDHRKDMVNYCGIGNISGKVINRGIPKSLLSVSGTLGYKLLQTPINIEVPLERPAIIVLHSDGLKNTWEWGTYPGLQLRHPLIISAIIYRDSKVTRDDQIILTIKVTREK